ncbi:MAG: LamG domain-containing protein [Candidatus Thorarchaeota archaeon]|jgi:hypothetical protein
MAVDFDGSTDYYSLTAKGGGLSVADGKTGTVSFWVKPSADGDDAAMTVLAQGSSTLGAARRLLISRASTNAFTIVGRRQTGAVVLSLASTSGVEFKGGSWYHVMASWDLENTLANLYINGTDRLDDTKTLTDVAIDYSKTLWEVGASAAASPREAFWNGVIDEIWFDDSYIDLSTAANRRLFYGQGSTGGGTTAGSQVGLGDKGSRPTGSRPKILLTHGPGNFGNNEGTAGRFTTVGTPAFSRGSPAANNTLSRGFKGQRWRTSERSGIPFPEDRLVIEPASGLEVARREYSTDRDEINRRKRFGHSIFEF